MGKMKKTKIIGLIGGMGPFASAFFYKLLLEKSVRKFGAKNCDDFPEILIDSVAIPDFISSKKHLPEARKTLISRIQKLDSFGCTQIALVCNTGHILFPELSQVANGKMISLIDSIKSKVLTGKEKRFGLLATRTTIRTKLFQSAFKDTGKEIINPDNKTLDLLEKVIRQVIANGKTQIFTADLRNCVNLFVRDKNLDGIILGCTELPLVFPKMGQVKIIDCLDILSDELLKNFFDSHGR